MRKEEIENLFEKVKSYVDKKMEELKSYNEFRFNNIERRIILLKGELLRTPKMEEMKEYLMSRRITPLSDFIGRFGSSFKNPVWKRKFLYFLEPEVLYVRGKGRSESRFIYVEGEGTPYYYAVKLFENTPKNKPINLSGLNERGLKEKVAIIIYELFKDRIQCAGKGSVLIKKKY